MNTEIHQTVSLIVIACIGYKMYAALLNAQFCDNFSSFCLDCLFSLIGSREAVSDTAELCQMKMRDKFGQDVFYEILLSLSEQTRLKATDHHLSEWVGNHILILEEP